ncbi:hypothetical protein [Sphingomonas pokkalii]|nr:hypothetical protein [Sphingomonas pokkalii]
MMAQVPIDAGDHLLRKLPNSMVEDYSVMEVTPHSGLGITYYEVDVCKGAAAQPTQTAIQHITNIFHGSNSRANINSTDNSINIQSGFNLELVRDFAAQVRSAKASLPDAQRQKIAEPLAMLEAAIHSSSPEPSKILGALRSIKSVAEGAAGNLVASGIVTMAGSILGG